MSNFTSPAAAARGPGRSTRSRQKALRWATLTVLLLLAAAAAGGT
ncbi:hypothetical protein [Ramlibacter ginsenosidimutans]|nr:hypothetical protein [Ramlibacter ginsenosidimutans]